MPYYSELGIYTPSSSYTSPLLKGPYSSHSSILASNILPPSSKQFNRSNFRNFKPHLMTISETTNVSLPLRRINSPKILYHSSPKVRVQRPVKINTADIDVSVNRYKKYSPQSKPQSKSPSKPESKSPSPQKELKPPAELKEAKPNTVIKRDRATIRLQTIHKDALEKEIGEIRSWRDNFKPEELVTEAKRRKRTPGEILKEKFLIRSKSKDNISKLEPIKLSRKSSVKKSPSFKDICNEITSDQAIEDLNPGQPVEIRRRQSRQISHDDLLKELHRSSSTLSVEEVQILDALLQAESEVGLYNLPPDIEEQPKSVRKKKAAKKKSSEKLGLEDKKTEKQESSATEGIILDEANQDLTKIPVKRVCKNYIKKSSSEISIPDTFVTPHTRLRKDSSLKNMVKDISQVEIEMIPVKSKPIITGTVGDIEEKARNNLKAIVKDLDIQESPKAEKKEKKFKFNVTVQEFPVKKTITAPKYELKKDNHGIIQLPCVQKPVITSILRKKEQIQQGNIAGDGKEFKKKEEKAVEKDVKKKLLKSLSEVQVGSTDQNKLHKSESNDSINNNFTVKVNRAKSDENFMNKSRGSNGKLKIISIEKCLDKVSGSQAIEEDKPFVGTSKDSLDNNVTIPKAETKIDKTLLKDEAKQNDVLLQRTKKDLKSDTFLCKTDIKKNENVPKWTERFRKDQTKSLEETTVTEKKEMPKKSISVEEKTTNELKTDTKFSEMKEKFTSTQKDIANKENFRKIEEAPEADCNLNSFPETELKDFKNEQNKRKETSKIEPLQKSSVKLRKEGKPTKDQTKSIEDAIFAEKKEMQKKNIFVDEKTTNKLKADTKVSEMKETVTPTQKDVANNDSFKKIEKHRVADININSSLKTESNDFKSEQNGREEIPKTQHLSKSAPKLQKDEKYLPKCAERCRKDQTKSLDESTVNEIPKKSDSVDEMTINELKVDIRVSEMKETVIPTEKDVTNKENIKKIEEAPISDSNQKTKLKDLKSEQNKKEETLKIEPLPKSSAKLRKEEKPTKDENDNQIDIWGKQGDEKYEPVVKLNKLKLDKKVSNDILNEILENHKELGGGEQETPEEAEKRMISKRSLIQKANVDDPDLDIFDPPTPPTPVPTKEPTPEPSFVPLQSNRLSQWMHPWKKPEQSDEPTVEIFAKPKFIRARHVPRRWNQLVVEDSEDSTTSEDDSSSEDSEDESGEESEEEQTRGAGSKVGASTSSSDSGFDSGRVNKNNGSIDSRDSPGNTLMPASNPAFALDFNDLPEEVSQSSTYQSFQRSGRITPPATTIPRFRKYCVDDFNFLKVLGKGSFGKVLLAELKGTEYYYAIKCLKKDVVLEDDDVECTLIERKVLALGTKHPYLCHLLCTFQTESHLFFVMEYLNGGDLMFHIQVERRFSEARARFYGAEIVSGLKFLHNKGIVYRDLKLDNILLDFDGHVRIADFGMCKLQIFLDRMADTFCGTPDYMAPEIIKGQHYNQCVDWWSFGVLVYEMLLGQSPFSGCDEDELFWSICNEKPVIPRFLSAEASSVLTQFLEKDANKRLGNRFSPHGDIQDHPFFKPIDWNALENRRLEPPFKPNLQHPLDTQYFDKTFTEERAKLTPIEAGILRSMDQTQFQGFSYTNPNATDK